MVVKIDFANVVDCDRVQENTVCAVGENARNGEKLNKNKNKTYCPRYRSKSDDTNTWTSLRGKRSTFIRDIRIKGLST